MKGVIYKWTCNISGKSYIGQTINEKRREKDFLTEGSYAGKKIDNARKKYGLSDGVWSKEILKRLWCKDGKEDELRGRLNYWERYYIEEFDTIKHGYNTTNGGDSNFSKEVLDEMRRKSKEMWDNMSEEEKERHKNRSKEYFNSLSKEEKEDLYRKAKEGYSKWRSTMSDEEFFRLAVECHGGHAIGRAVYSSKINRGRKLSEEFRKRLSELNSGRKQRGNKVRKYSECGGTLLEEFESLVDAAKSIGVNVDSLYGCDNFSGDGFYLEIERRKEPKGYRWKKRLSRWNSLIHYNGKEYDLGCFKHEEAAHEMYLIAKRKIKDGTFLDWELNNKFDEKIKLYEKYGEKMRNLV